MTAVAGMRSRWRGRFQLEQSSSRWGLAALALVLFVAFHLLYGNFATWSNGVNILTNAAPVLIAAIPAARLIIAGNVDLSIAGSYALLSIVCGWALKETGSPIAAIVVTLVAGAVLGVLNGMLVRFLRISPIIVTIALMGIYTGTALTLTNGASIFGFPQGFLTISQGRILGVPGSLVVAMVIFVTASWYLTRTVSGVRSYAIGGNERASELVGINVGRHVILLYVMMQVAMGICAVITASQVGTATPQTGLGFEFAVLTAVMLGGVSFNGGSGRPLGILFGVATLGILQTGFVFAGFNSYSQQVAQGLLLLIALSLDQMLAKRSQRLRHRALTDDDETLEAGTASAPDDRFEDRTIGPVVLAGRGLQKAYGSVVAVREVSLEVRAGEIVCLAGDNGAGKSTVIKMLSGATVPDAGTIEIAGEPVSLETPTHARDLGIETVHQELTLAPNLGAAVNMALGREPALKRLPFPKVLDRQSTLATAKERLGTLGVSRITNYLRPVAEMSGGQRQSITIARTAQDGIRLVILDEPTAALGVKQTANVLNLIRHLASQGTGVILVTHDVGTILEIADRVIVLSLGAVIHDGARADLTEPELIHLMAGYTGPATPDDRSAPVSA
jgi:ribose/xylose/arabinose/galactoside ABC-type transport system permease subunit/ABC-type branched-subunit amino acid transport system ATPase component